jgi:cation transport regulator ChaC
MPLYFAYGSCMNQADLARSEPRAVYLGSAVLRNYRLAFSRFSQFRGGGVADIVREPGEWIEGVLFEVPDFEALDRREGAPFVYRRRKVRVYPESLGGRWRWAWTYEVVEKSPVEIAPSREYALLIWEGARVLSLEYRKKLKENLLGRMGEFL